MVDNNFPPNMGQQGIPMGQPQGNPLAKHLRQPKIYIKLPSNGILDGISLWKKRMNISLRNDWQTDYV